MNPNKTTPFVFSRTGGILFCLLLVLGGLPLIGAHAQQRQSSTLNYKPSVYGVPLIQVRLADHVTATFAIDTGSNYNVLTDAMAAKLGLISQPYPSKAQPAIFDGEPARSVSIHLTQIGELKVGDMLFLIAKEKRQKYLFGEPIDGVLGTYALQYFSAFFDFPKHQVSLIFPGGLTRQEIEKLGFISAFLVPLEQSSDDGTYSVSAVLTNSKDTITEHLLLDTGSSMIALNYDQAQRLKLKPFGQEQKIDLASGTTTVKLSRVSLFSMGPITYQNQRIAYSLQQRAGPGVIGVDVLAGYKVLLDFPNQKMYIRRDILPGAAVRIGPP